MYINLQYNIIVQASFVEAYYNQIGDSVHCCTTDQPREILTSDPSGFGQCQAFPSADLCHATVTTSPVSNP